MPRVSVLLPVYNAELTVRRAAQSILDQSMSDLELIVVDDGSTDQSAKVVSEIKDSRIRLIRENHHGVSRTANTAFQHARGELIARMDADDVSRPDRLARQLQYIEQHKADVVGSQVRMTTLSGQSVPSMSRYEQWINRDTMSHDEIVALRFVEFPLVNPTIMARKSYFEMQFAEGDFPEDYDLMLRAASSGMKFGKVKSELLQWADSEGRLTRNSNRYSEGAFMDCRRSHFRNDVLRDVDCVDLWGGGKTGKRWFHWLQKEGVAIRRVIEVDARKVGTVFNKVPVIHFDQMPGSDGTVLISAVGAMGAREKIQKHCEERGYQSGKNLWFVA